MYEKILQYVDEMLGVCSLEERLEILKDLNSDLIIRIEITEQEIEDFN